MKGAVPYVLLAVFFAVEVLAPRGRRGPSERRDRGTLIACWLLAGGGFTTAFFLGFSPSTPLRTGAWASWAGAAVTAAGAFVRFWSIRVLGQWFTRTVEVSADQPVVEAGPYRLVRHPSYTGLLLMALGIGLSLGTWISVLAIMAPAVVTLVLRIRVEEAALADAIGEPYRAYMRRTKRLIPWVL